MIVEEQFQTFVKTLATFIVKQQTTSITFDVEIVRQIIT